MRKVVILIAVLVLSVTLVIGACAPAEPTPAPAPAPAPSPTPVPKPAESAADFYAKNVATLVVTYAPGGGTDLAGRLFASWWTEATGGAMIVKNRSTGGGVEGCNYVYTAKPDGLTLGITVQSSAIIAPYLFKEQGVVFDPKKYNWIGFFGEDGYTLTLGKNSPYKTMDDVKNKKEFKFASDEARGNMTLGATVLAECFGMSDARIIAGYGGTSEAALAVGRGEVDGMVINDHTTKDLMDKNIAKPPPVAVASQRSKWFPDTPAIPEMVKLTPQAEKLLTIWGGFVGGKVVFTTPGVPQDRVKFMQEAFDKIMADKNFLKEINSLYPVWIPPTSGPQVAEGVQKQLSLPESDIQAFQAAYQKYVK